MSQKVAIRFLGTGRYVMPLPIGLTSKGDQTGEVICDPVGLFEPEDTEALLARSGPDGPFRRVEAAGAPQRQRGGGSSFPPPQVRPPKVSRETSNGRNRVFKGKGFAVIQRNKHFPGAEVVEGPAGTWTITDTPSLAAEGHEPSLHAEGESEGVAE